MRIVAAVAKLYMKPEEDGVDCSPLTEAFESKGLGAPDFALFWDFASLYQKPRTEEQEGLFLPGLRASNVWYGHELSPPSPSPSPLPSPYRHPRRHPRRHP